jgi:polygalacturonase
MPMSTAVSAALLLCGAALTSTANPAKTVTDDTTAEAGAPKMCDVRRHGARGDNSTDDTAAFVAAIAACSGAAPTGRGVVVAPAPGTYLLKPLELKDNVELQILAGATLVLWPFGPNYPNYTSAHVRPGGEIPEAGCFNNPTGTFACVSSGCKQTESQIPMSFLWGENVSNVAIGGGGTIDGQGLAWWLSSWWKRRDLNMYWRPKLFEFPGATDLTLGGEKGLLLVNSPMWNTALHRNSRLTVTNVTVHSPSEWINTDGINFSGEDIYVADCTVFNGDDCVPVFAASGARGTRNVLVERVACHGGTNAGIVVNCVHPSGSAQNLTFRDIIANGTMHGAGIKSCSAQFPATIADVRFESITMTNVRKSGSGAIYVNAFGQDTDAGSQYSVATEYTSSRSSSSRRQVAAASDPLLGGIPKLDDALLRVHNISFIDIAVSSPANVMPGKFSCAALKGSCTGFYMRNVTVAGHGRFACTNVIGSAGPHVTPAACFEPAGKPPSLASPQVK